MAVAGPPAPTSVAVVVAAHGSRAEAANLAHRDIVDALDARIGPPVTPAFLELAQPSIPEGIDAAVAAGAATVLVLPYFLHPGRHLSDDLPAIVAEATDRHPGHQIRLLESFGSDVRLLELLAAQVEAGLGL
ncbi:CbiX/SirB N-terminal domain-containing protein [Aquihabitans sp. G128]|uniref:sirohydrochlorin chelatase n=1 Tax=Aquihabitans sp. G128 TaxID=2849779 RepID=UPI001C21C32C|nr:CbiX/SirB N-terminal domain-containing protein [Aquihabitans sp. G128]QXC59708.1 CbiX/SirB N-terminal domain-containing protein [Aquihabitans sp. G128]